MPAMGLDVGDVVVEDHSARLDGALGHVVPLVQ